MKYPTEEPLGRCLVHPHPRHQKVLEKTEQRSTQHVTDKVPAEDYPGHADAGGPGAQKDVPGHQKQGGAGHEHGHERGTGRVARREGELVRAVRHRHLGLLFAGPDGAASPGEGLDGCHDDYVDDGSWCRGTKNKKRTEKW